MADRRMFSKTIIDSDAFLDMPLSAQCLYFHLSMRADDEGFVNNPKKIQRMIGASDDDLKLLIAKQFVLVFETGIIVIKHWKIHNYIRGDRLNKTAYQDERRLLTVKDNGAYDWQADVSQMSGRCLSSDSQMSAQDRLGKDSIGKIRIGQDNIGKVRQAATDDDEDARPRFDTVEAYAANNLQYLSPNNMIELVSFRDDLPEDLIIHAIDKACEQGKRFYSYVKGILNGYLDDGIKTVGDAKAAEEKFKQQKGGGKQTSTKQDFQQHGYTEADFDESFYYDPTKDYGGDIQ